MRTEAQSWTNDGDTTKLLDKIKAEDKKMFGVEPVTFDSSVIKR